MKPLLLTLFTVILMDSSLKAETKKMNADIQKTILNWHGKRFSETIQVLFFSRKAGYISITTGLHRENFLSI
jgi:hypothetical protein